MCVMVESLDNIINYTRWPTKIWIFRIQSNRKKSPAWACTWWTHLRHPEKTSTRNPFTQSLLTTITKWVKKMMVAIHMSPLTWRTEEVEIQTQDLSLPLITKSLNNSSQGRKPIFKFICCALVNLQKSWLYTAREHLILTPTLEQTLTGVISVGGSVPWLYW